MAPRVDGKQGRRSAAQELRLYAALATASQLHLASCQARDWPGADYWSAKISAMTALLQDDGAGPDLSVPEMLQKRLLGHVILRCQQQAQLYISGKIDVVNLLSRCSPAVSGTGAPPAKENAMMPASLDLPAVRTLGTVALSQNRYAYLQHQPGIPYQVTFYCHGLPVHQAAWTDLQCSGAPYALPDGTQLDAADMLALSRHGWEIIDSHGS